MTGSLSYNIIASEFEHDRQSELYNIIASEYEHDRQSELRVWTWQVVWAYLLSMNDVTYQVILVYQGNIWW